uniref:DUF3456 domain-containing protein n=1 Tax=Caenorhabditis japonica TaxID=281687 RepID=A0A8R1HJV2_CAEJA
MFLHSFLQVFTVFLALQLVDAASISSLECGACSLLVTHFELKIAAVDPNKKIEVGSFRVSPTGEQKGLKEIGYARSETHLTEIIEHVCDEAKNYKLVMNTNTGKSVYVHKDVSQHLDGDESAKMRSRLQNACNDFIDANEDELLHFLKSAHEKPVKEFCHKTIGVCSSVDVADLPPVPITLADIPEDEL